MDFSSLHEDQKQMIQELASLQSRIDLRVQRLSSRLNQMEVGDAERAQQEIQLEQAQLTRLIQRVHATLSDREELEREYLGWKKQENSSRAEIVTSELRARGWKERPQQESCQQPTCDEISIEPTASSEESTPVIFVPEQLPEGQTDNLLRALQEAGREARRFVVFGDRFPQEAAEQFHHLRDLHTELQNQDRKQHQSRARFELFY